MKLQLLVPHFKESAEVVKPLLDSVAIQQNVDFADIGIIITNDGEEATVLDRNWLDSYPFKIEYYTIPHYGLSTARNYCMDKATADYVMFCDCDDMFFHAYGISWIIAEMEQEFDAMISTFVEETRTEDRKMVAFYEHELDPIFVHGKVYRLGYLRGEGIRFPDGLNLNEDSPFNILALELAPRVKNMPKPFYMWKWREGSTVRRWKDYSVRFFGTIVDANSILLDGFLSRGKTDCAKVAFGTHLIKAFCEIESGDEKWTDNFYLIAIERERQHLADYGFLWEMLSEEDRQHIIDTLEINVSASAVQEWFQAVRGW